MTTLNAQVRTTANKVANKALKEAGQIPAVFYGANKDATSLSVDKKEFDKVFKTAGETATIVLKTDAGEFNAMIHDVQHDPVTGAVIHADFLSIDMNKPIEVHVPFEFVGDSEAVKGGGVLVKVMHEVEISALPAKIPQHFTVDISKLAAIDDTITVGDIALPEGVTFTDADTTRVIASVTAQQDEPETPVEMNLDAIEVEKKGKKEEEPAPTE